jgi:hypothetical protein
MDQRGRSKRPPKFVHLGAPFLLERGANRVPASRHRHTAPTLRAHARSRVVLGPTLDTRPREARIATRVMARDRISTTDE